ncbi:MAG: 16S rRNA (guanine(966)-N(2))-methyltransferase RsmD [Omnitrophica WOR_2 bacterium RIFCSPHIGHO2_02_FULL_46_37]|nr:MAG: 16S rRNA (guanine(966)-N(2))-methyltransferase RsmD [Omnitrophica WOR_2 bacterium RIFCSPHIGHO2_02_FULL_46_37]OGX42508.1 MAG: 16S rRNA (guanine(966)-N(2))-methyltransferase RsmD [Omnitrophica WOR_2 bacterium RIFCSPLOWO2_02_FULL_45_28]
MQIISGIFRGRKLRFPKDIRPTQNKIRKAIFDCLGNFVRKSAVLELFAGSGAVGIEALSCGAREVTFVDNEARCLRLIESNLRALNVPSYALHKKDSLKAIDFLSIRGLRFDIIFLDPPYRQDLAKKSLLKISGCDIVTPSGIVVLEHHRKEELPEREGSLMLFKQKRYGEKVLSFYRR